MLGAACIEAMHVAAGVAHGAVTLNGKLWDIAAAAAIAIEAGAIVTDPRGGQIFPFNLKGYAGAKVPYVMAGSGGACGVDQGDEEIMGVWEPAVLRKRR